MNLVQRGHILRYRGLGLQHTELGKGDNSPHSHGLKYSITVKAVERKLTWCEFARCHFLARDLGQLLNLPEYELPHL